MSEQRYDLIFRGDIVLGQDLAQVKARLQQLFKADAARIDALFSGRPVTLKRDLDEESAKKYQQVLARAGAEVTLASAGELKAARPKGLTLAPVGALLLRPRERYQRPEIEVDISALSLKPATGHLLEAAERMETPIDPVEVPDFTLAEVGALLDQENARVPLPQAELAENQWDLSPPGADLLKPEERVPEPQAPVASLQAELAPVGSDLGQIKNQSPSVTPDISALRLLEESD